MEIRIRQVSTTDPGELQLVVERCMRTVLETIPEFEMSEVRAREVLPNFTVGQMTDMIRADLSDPSKRIVLAENNDGAVGQMLYSLKTDDEGAPFGFCFSLYVEPAVRRGGIATALLEDAMEWFRSHDASYVVAHTHAQNLSVLNLLPRYGFVAKGPLAGQWPYYLLRAELSGTDAG